MGTELTYTDIADQLSNLPGLSPEEIRVRLNNYIETLLMPPATEEEILTAIERSPAVPGQQRQLPRYTNEDRETRHAQSVRMRQCIAEYAGWSHRVAKSYFGNGAQISRAGHSLFYYENSGMPDPRNREVLWLVDKNPDNRLRYIEEKKQSLMGNGKTEEQAQQEADAYFSADAMSARLSKLVLERLRESAALFPRLEEMTSPQLSADQLAQNYIAISQAYILLMELDTLIRFASDGSGRLQIQPEELHYLQSLKDIQIGFGQARLPLEVIANPYYEIVDPLEIVDSDTSKLMSIRNSLFEGEKWEAQKQRYREMDPDYGAIAIHASDNLKSYIEDCMNLRFLIATRADEREQNRMAEIYGFRRGSTTQVCESRLDYALIAETHSPLLASRPIAYETGSRVIILTASGTNSQPAVTADTPEVLFNFSLQKKNAAILELLASTDVWYKRSSPEYKEMKAALGRACAIEPLRTDETADKREELKAARLPYNTLLAAVEAYLRKKPDRSDNPYEDHRIQAAKQVKSFAELKLRELDLIQKARITLQRYKGMNEEEIRIATTAENAEIDRLNAAENRRQDPFRWFGELHDQYVRLHLSQSFCGKFSRVIEKQRNARRDENGIFLKEGNEKFADDARLLIGYSIAGEMILRERAQRDQIGLAGRGPIETTFFGSIRSVDKWASTLADKFFDVVVRMSANQLNMEELTHVLDSFDPKATADKLMDRFSILCNAQFVNDVEFPCANPALNHPTIQEFIKSSILAPARDFQKRSLEENADIPFAPAYGMINGLMLVTMAGVEGQTAERLRMLMKNRDNITDILGLISSSPTFRDLVSKFDFGLENTNIFSLRDLTGKEKTRAAALEIMSEEPFSDLVNSMWKEQCTAAAKNSDDFITAVLDQYTRPVFGQPPLSAFVNDFILVPAQSYQARMAAMEPTTDFVEGYHILCSCVLANIMQIGAKTDLPQLMSSKDSTEAVLQLIQASQPFRDMIGKYDAMGNRPDINEIPRLIRSKQPQAAALKILKSVELRQMLGDVVRQQNQPVQRIQPQAGNLPVGPGRA